MNNFKLPKSFLVNRFIAKSIFAKKVKFSNKIKDEFTYKVKKITWLYKIAEINTNIPKTETVEEIHIFEIILKERMIPENVLKVIDKSISYPILYILKYKDEFIYSISLIDNSNYYFSDWNQNIDFDFNGINLEIIYQNIVKEFIKKVDIDNKNFEEIIILESKINRLEKEIVNLKEKIRKEKRFNRQVELNKILLKKKEELKKIK